ncbi:MAG: hypothetical protein KIT72_08135 [Polyangiaceae bacterium]|nr:hypothetical protein [Polyangiaceae bacterium]MCW5790375.1 hypothetical protein [Polyangiaceae bacterium]
MRSQGQKALIYVGTVIAGLALLGVVYVLTRPPPEAKGRPGQELLRELELTASQSELEALFGSALREGGGKYTIDFRFGQDSIRRAELSRGLPGSQQISKVTVFFNRLDRAAVVARLQELAPHRHRTQTANSDRVFTGDTVLDVSATNLSLWHWDSTHPANGDYAKCGERLGAYWALARWAAFDGEKPTAEQLKLINGPTLEEIATLDGSVTVEQATDAFHRQLPAGWCRTQAGVTCVADVGDELIDEVRWRWPNGLRARVQEARLALRKAHHGAEAQRTIAGCLNPLLGESEELVIDYVKGVRNFRWKDDVGGGVVLGERELVLSAGDQAPLDQPGAWVERFPKIVAALDHCKL